jgi:uncharacterized protein (TIGR00255 family)
MTGFGRGVAQSEQYKVTVELKSVNNRYLEVAVHAPKLILFLESTIKNQVAQFAERGKVDVFIQLENIGESSQQLKVDKNLACAYVEAISEIQSAAGLPSKLTVENLLGLPGLFSMEKPEDNLEDIEAVLLAALAEALSGFAAMRRLEGERLAADLLKRRESVCALVQQIDGLSEQVVQDYQAKLFERINELLSDKVAIDEARLANEVAYFADHACINEELVRLVSHLAQLEELLQKDAAVGRKLDFLMQEINREVNTIGSKANYLQINRLVIEAKSELEKIREQIQNIE